MIANSYSLHLFFLFAFATALATAHAAPEATSSLSAKAYVQSGLIGCWDAIENAGWGQHDANATSWVDLAGTAGNINLSARTDVTWQSDRLEFSSATGFVNANAVTLTDCSIEIATRPHGNIRRFDAETWTGTFESWYNDSEGELERISNTRICAGAKLLDTDQIFVTTYVSKFHTARSYLTDGTLRKKSTATGNNATALSSSRFAFLRNNGSRAYFIRVYKRGLSDAEIAWNGMLDRHRYFGGTLSDTALTDRRVSDGVVELRLVASVDDAEHGTVSLTHSGGTESGTEITRWAALDESSTVTLAAYPVSGAVFARWEGDTAGIDVTSRTLTLTNDFARSLTARFVVGHAATEYSRDGLVAQWDGLDNSGYGYHVPTATKWTDLSGNGWNLTKTANGAWTNSCALHCNGSGWGAYTSATFPTFSTSEIVFRIRKAQNGVIACRNGDPTRMFIIQWPQYLGLNGSTGSAPQVDLGSDYVGKIFGLACAYGSGNNFRWRLVGGQLATLTTASFSWIAGYGDGYYVGNRNGGGRFVIGGRGHGLLGSQALRPAGHRKVIRREFGDGTEGAKCGIIM